jgi:hypothetical protein
MLPQLKSTLLTIAAVLLAVANGYNRQHRETHQPPNEMLETSITIAIIYAIERIVVIHAATINVVRRWSLAAHSSGTEPDRDPGPGTARQAAHNAQRR